MGKSGRKKLNVKKNKFSFKTKHAIFLAFTIGIVWVVLILNVDLTHSQDAVSVSPIPNKVAKAVSPIAAKEEKTVSPIGDKVEKAKEVISAGSIKLSKDFQDVLDRAKDMKRHCSSISSKEKKEEGELEMVEDTNTEFVKEANTTTARLKSFGIIQMFEDYHNIVNDNTSNKAKSAINNSLVIEHDQCTLPPETECAETQLTVIFMAYNPDRLDSTFIQMKSMLQDSKWKLMVAEIVLVWNGPREINESSGGQTLLSFSHENPEKLRVVYPIKAGLQNDLMNRYHPNIVNVHKTNGILFYDDDGPFYSYEAVLGGFELWKRNSNTQIGAMSRKFNLNKRQGQEKNDILLKDNNNNEGLSATADRHFVSYCPNVDQVGYNFFVMPHFEANMVLPSGSILHRNYLCYLWHPALQPIRQFVLDHPVHPDDMTVSMIVTQLAGRAPKVYSRRIRENPLRRRRRLSSQGSLEEMEEEEQQNDNYDDLDQYYLAKEKEYDYIKYEEYEFNSKSKFVQQQKRVLHGRKLLFGIDWDAGSKMNSNKKVWAKLREGALNSLVRIFGSLNSGSIGWCYGTQYHIEKKHSCNPEMAIKGTLPWLTSDHQAKETCP